MLYIAIYNKICYNIYIKTKINWLHHKFFLLFTFYIILAAGSSVFKTSAEALTIEQYFRFSPPKDYIVSDQIFPREFGDPYAIVGYLLPERDQYWVKDGSPDGPFAIQIILAAFSAEALNPIPEVPLTMSDYLSRVEAWGGEKLGTKKIGRKTWYHYKGPQGKGGGRENDVYGIIEGTVLYEVSLERYSNVPKTFVGYKKASKDFKNLLKKVQLKVPR